MMPNSTLLLLVEVLILQPFLVHGFVVRHPSGLQAPASRFGVKTKRIPAISNRHVLKSSASIANDAVRNTTVPATNSSVGKTGDRDALFFEELEGDGIRRYPWSDLQQWALRDNLPKYTIRIPIQQTATVAPAKSESSTAAAEDTVLEPFALWRSLQNDVPELAGYPIEFLRARHEDMRRDQENHVEDTGGVGVDNKATIRVVQHRVTPGVLPFLQSYEFSAGGGICGDVYGMNGVSDGSRIETSALRNVKESLPKGYVQTSDGGASFELGAPLRSDEGMVSTASAAAKEFGAEKLSDLSTKQLRTLANSVEEDGDGMLLRLGALSGVLLAGATAINMLSHHLTVNVFWV